MTHFSRSTKEMAGRWRQLALATLVALGAGCGDETDLPLDDQPAHLSQLRQMLGLGDAPPASRSAQSSAQGVGLGEPSSGVPTRSGGLGTEPASARGPSAASGTGLGRPPTSASGDQPNEGTGLGRQSDARNEAGLGDPPTGGEAGDEGGGGGGRPGAPSGGSGGGSSGGGSSGGGSGQPGPPSGGGSSGGGGGGLCNAVCQRAFQCEAIERDSIEQCLSNCARSLDEGEFTESDLRCIANAPTCPAIEECF